MREEFFFFSFIKNSFIYLFSEYVFQANSHNWITTAFHMPTSTWEYKFLLHFFFFFCSIEWDVAKGSVEADRGEGGRGGERNLQKPYTEIRWQITNWKRAETVYVVVGRWAWLELQPEPPFAAHTHTHTTLSISSDPHGPRLFAQMHEARHCDYQLVR